MSSPKRSSRRTTDGVSSRRYGCRAKKRLTPAKAAIAPAEKRPTRFVVVHVRQALQHAGASGAYSAARLVSGVALTVSCLSTSSV